MSKYAEIIRSLLHLTNFYDKKLTLSFKYKYDNKNLILNNMVIEDFEIVMNSISEKWTGEWNIILTIFLLIREDRRKYIQNRMLYEYW